MGEVITEMETIEATKETFSKRIQNDPAYLKIEISHGAFNKQIAEIDNVVGFLHGKAVVVTDLDEQQAEYYDRQKR